MPIRRYNQTAGARDNTGSLGTTSGAGGTILLTAAQTATGTYSSGPAGATEYFLGDITATGAGILTFNDYVGIVGWPEVIDTTANPATMAQIATNEAAPDNWLFDENTGLVVPARRMKISLSGAEHGNAGFISGTSTDIVFVGVDFYVANGGSLNVGGVNGTAAAANRIRFYNCRVFVEGTGAFRFRGISQDLQIRGLQVISNGPTDFTTEFIVDAAGRPTVFDNFRMVSTNLTAAGDESQAGTQNGPLPQARQLLYPNIVGDGELRGLEANSMTFFTFANRAANLQGTYTLINPQVNIIKTMDQGFGVASQHLNAFANQWLVINREILPTAITTGGTSGSTAGEQPEITVVRRPTGLAFSKEGDNTNFQTTPLVPIATPANFTGYDTVVYNVNNTTDIDGALTISNDGELTGTLLQYFDSVPTTTVNETGANGPLVQMYNRYRIALTRHGFSSFVLDDHFIGGECPATFDANDTYFGLTNLAGRQRYSPIGESLAAGNIIDLPVDGFVTESTEATVIGYTSGATGVRQLYDAIHYHGNNRLDGDGLQKGVQLASVNAGLVDFGSRNLVLTDTDTTTSAANGALSAITGTATGDITIATTDTFADPVVDFIIGMLTTGTLNVGSQVLQGTTDQDLVVTAASMTNLANTTDATITVSTSTAISASTTHTRSTFNGTYTTGANVEFSACNLPATLMTVGSSARFDQGTVMSGTFATLAGPVIADCTMNGTFNNITGTPTLLGNTITTDLGSIPAAGTYTDNDFGAGSEIDASGSYTFTGGSFNGLAVNAVSGSGVSLTLANVDVSSVTPTNVSAFTGTFEVTPTGTTDNVLQAFVDAGWTVNAAAQTRVIQVPADQRNGFFAVRNITTDTELVAPVAVSTTSSYSITSSAYNGTDTIRFYWRPTTTAAAGYNTTIFDFSGSVTDGTTDLAPQRIAGVLWEDVVDTTGSATAAVTEGDTNFGGVDRIEIQYTNSSGNLDDSNLGAARTLYRTLLAANNILYVERMVDNELDTDIITSSGSEVQIDSRYAYVDTGDTNTQTITAASRNPTSALANAPLAPNTLGLTGGGTTPSVTILPNPLGATPGQISAAVGSGVAAGVDSSNTGQSIVEVNRRTAWMISDGNRTAHFKPNTNGNFDDDVAYEDNSANNPT